MLLLLFEWERDFAPLLIGRHGRSWSFIRPGPHFCSPLLSLSISSLSVRLAGHSLFSLVAAAAKCQYVYSLLSCLSV